MRKLLKEGARVDERRGDGATPLHVHAENGNCAVVAELLRGKVDIDSKDKVCHCFVCIHFDYIIRLSCVWCALTN